MTTSTAPTSASSTTDYDDQLAFIQLLANGVSVGISDCPHTVTALTPSQFSPSARCDPSKADQPATFYRELHKLIDKHFAPDWDDEFLPECGDEDDDLIPRTEDQMCQIGEALMATAAQVMDLHSMDRRYYAETGLVLDPGEQNLFLGFGALHPHNRTSYRGDTEDRSEELAEGVLWMLAGITPREGPDFAKLAKAVAAQLGSDDWITAVAEI